MSRDEPLLTPDLPGIGGRIKVELDDFEVEEIPAYVPSGAGSHLYLWLEKRDFGGEFFLRELSKWLGVRPGDIGTAGLKDRRAVTRQWVSVPESAESHVPQIDCDNIRVLEVSRHNNKLRPGHLRGNRFRVLIRDVEPDAATRATAILDRISTNGLPNYYGDQRFGRDGDNAELGMKQLRGEAVGRLNPFMRKMSLSAVQSMLFNECLAGRLRDGVLRTVLPGDVLAKWPAGGMFTSTDAVVDQPRLDAREVVPAGPMFGKKTFSAAGVVAEREAAVLAGHGLTTESFHGFGQLLDGTRRHYFVYVDDLCCEPDANGLRLTFSLPAGSYATVLLREVMKDEPTKL
jgi:tRNA pseudouridine13 synthase